MIPDGLSQPIGELLATIMNARTGEILRRALQENNKGTMKVTGSQVMLHWLNNHEKAVKQLVRNRVIEILRFTESLFISSHNMIADLTRISGFDWMRKDKDFPIKLLDQVRLSREETSDFAPALSKEFLDFQATIECGFTETCM